MISISSNGSTISADLGRIGYRTTKRLATVVPEAAIDVRDEWRANLEESTGTHGPHAPASIRYRIESMLEAIVYPDEDMKQGGMSWEFGSRNQPAHLDGQRALDLLAPRIERRMISALVF